MYKQYDIIIDNDTIMDKYIDKNNKYTNYCFDIFLLNYQCIRVNKLINILEDNQLNLDFNDKILRIEEILKNT